MIGYGSGDLQFARPCAKLETNVSSAEVSSISLVK